MDGPESLLAGAVKIQQDCHDRLLHDNKDSDENPYLTHQELSDQMSRVATVIRKNDQLSEAIVKVNEPHERAMKVNLADTGAWTNQNVIFAKALT